MGKDTGLFYSCLFYASLCCEFFQTGHVPALDTSVIAFEHLSTYTDYSDKLYILNMYLLMCVTIMDM